MMKWLQIGFGILILPLLIILISGPVYAKSTKEFESYYVEYEAESKLLVQTQIDLAGGHVVEDLDRWSVFVVSMPPGAQQFLTRIQPSTTGNPYPIMSFMVKLILGASICCKPSMYGISIAIN